MCMGRSRSQRRAEAEAQQMAVAEATRQRDAARDSAMAAARGPQSNARDLIAARRSAVASFARTMRRTNFTGGIAPGNMNSFLGRSNLLGG